MEDLRARTTLFCGVIAFAIALSMLLRGRRAAHWLFAAFAGSVAFWYVSQSLQGLAVGTEHEPLLERVTAALSILLSQFAVRLFHSITPLEERPEDRSSLPKIAAIVGLPLFIIALTPWTAGSETIKALVRGGVYLYVVALLATALLCFAGALAFHARLLPAVISAVATAVVFFVLLDKLLDLPLPRGPLGI